MLAIFKRELKAMLCGYRGYTFFGIFAIGFCIVRMVYHYLFIRRDLFILSDAGAYTNFSLTAPEYMLIYLPFVFVLALPILTFSLFDKERVHGTMGLLKSLPLTMTDVFFGKYLSVLTVFTASFGIMTLLTWFLGFYSRINILTVIISLVSYFLLGNSIMAIYIFISSVCKNKYVSLGISYGVAVVLCALAMLRSTVPTLWSEALERVSVIGSYLSSLFGVLDICTLVLALSTWAVFLYLAYINMKKIKA